MEIFDDLMQDFRSWMSDVDNDCSYGRRNYRVSNIIYNPKTGTLLFKIGRKTFKMKNATDEDLEERFKSAYAHYCGYFYPNLERLEKKILKALKEIDKTARIPDGLDYYFDIHTLEFDVYTSKTQYCLELSSVGKGTDCVAVAVERFKEMRQRQMARRKY